MNMDPTAETGSFGRIVSAAVALAALAVAVAAPVRVGARGTQTQPGSAAPAFEVASIKPNNSGDGRVMLGNQPGRFTATNVTLRMLIRQAYQLQDFQITGGPSWLNSDHFDIVAKIDPAVQESINAARGGIGPAAIPGQGPNPLQLMIRSLLAERFKLVVHNETKEQTIYALVLAHSDGKLGPDLKKSDVDCAALMNARARGQAAAPPGPPQAGQRMPCAVRIGPGNLSASAGTLAQFAQSLGMFVGRVVVDKTGLTGGYDIDLTWTPDQMPQRAGGAPGDQPVRVNGVDIDPNGPSIFTAVQEQLGLKLDSQKGPVEMLVIDRAEKPVEN
ncbi:MAG TPA: TIGR03435 family protein [Vicinamibacterales bacterium]|nr:TIGR03435 family protein [Vicinamibacterales bacterium]